MTIYVNKDNRDIVIERIERDIEVADVGIQGPQGPLGPAGGQAFVHSQGTPSATWVINHGLGRRPAIEIYTVGWVEVEAPVIHNSINQATIQLNLAMTGFAVCA